MKNQRALTVHVPTTDDEQLALSLILAHYRQTPNVLIGLTITIQGPAEIVNTQTILEQWRHSGKKN